MLRHTLNLIKLYVPSNGTPCSTILPNYCQTVISKHLHITSNFYGKRDDKKLMIRSMPKPDEGTEGETIFELDSSSEDIFPNENTPNRLFNGIPFNQIPICNIRTTPNNTIFTIADHNGLVKILYSCGIEGYKNARKGTNIAAQSSAITFGTKALTAGYKTVRVRVRGLGPGRMSSIKGLEMAGLNIISITDSTRVSWFPPRPRKARRV